MPEAIDERVEIAWLNYFNRFRQVIYPTIFESQGISYETALKLWSDEQSRVSLEELIGLLKEKNEL